MPATVDIAAALTTAMAAIKLDKLISAAAADTDVTDGSLLAQMVSKAAAAGVSLADWSTFNPMSDSLEAIRDEGDAAWRTGSGAFSDLTSIPTASQMVQGTSQVNDFAALEILGGNKWEIREINAGTLLEGIVTFAANPLYAGSNPAKICVWGYYAGSPAHYINVEAWNYAASTPGWEVLGTMPNASIVTYYTYLPGPGHIKADGEMKLRFIHNAGTGAASHYLYLDKVEFHTLSAPATQVDANVVDWKGAAAPAMTGDAFAAVGGLTAPDNATIAKVLKYIANKMVITDASGDYVIYDDNGSTPLVTGNIVDNATSTIRSEPDWTP